MAVNPLPLRLPSILPGIKYQITKEKLICFYLSNKVSGLQSEIEAAFIPECELYNNREPWEIFQDHVGGHQDDDLDLDDDAAANAGGGLYCFTRLKKASAKKIGRTVGKGTWHAEGKPKVYRVRVRGESCVAYHKRYLYKNKDSSDHDKRWSLHEYSCPHVSDDVVICSLEKNPIRRSSSYDRIPTPTLKRKSLDDDDCSASKRMRIEVESPPPTYSSSVEDGGCRNLPRFVVESPPTYSSGVEDGGCRNLPRFVVESPTYSSGVEDGGCRNLPRFVVESQPTYSSGVEDGGCRNLLMAPHYSSTPEANSAHSSNCVEDGGFMVPEFNTDNCTDVALDETNTEICEVTNFHVSGVEEEGNAGIVIVEGNCYGMSIDTGLNVENGEAGWSAGTEPNYNITEEAAVGSDESGVGSGSSLPDWIESYKKYQELEDEARRTSEEGGRFKDMLTEWLEEEEEEDNLDGIFMSDLWS